MTPEERLRRLREVAERLRQRAQELPGTAIEPDPVLDPSGPADRPLATKPEPSAPPPRHWAETDVDPDDQEDTTDAN